MELWVCMGVCGGQGALGTMDTTGGISEVVREVAQPGGGGSAAALSAADLAELVAAFHGVTARLQATHEVLTAEVARLKAELVEANQQVERTKRLAALGEMAAGISHEIRNPLGSIKLYARMLQQDLAPQPAQREIADKIAGAVVKLDAVVGDVLAFSRELKVRRMALDSGDVLRTALESARDGSALWAGVAVKVTVAEAEVWADPHLLHQALVNVIRNAAEAMVEVPRRTLTLEARSRTLPRAGTGEGERVTLLSVRDSGPGIPAEVAERMFNPFFTTRAAGTGLGLAIVHRIMDAHGGRVNVRNPKSGGAAVDLVLPRAQAGDGVAGGA